MAFAEAFDPLWQAQIYQNGSLLQASNSKTLYGTINGFEINPIMKNDGSQTDRNPEIVIKYLPQELFEIGIKISLLILLILLILVLFVTIKYREKRLPI